MNEQVFLGGAPVVGFVDSDYSSPAVPKTSPWTIALATSVVSAVTGWVVEEIAQNVRGRKRR